MSNLLGAVDKASTLAANLAVLQRKDPSIVQIRGHASHVSVYIFNPANGQWDRKDVEGSLFVVERATAPVFQMVVLNRLNLNNMVQAVTSNLKLRVMDPYLMFQSTEPCVCGPDSCASRAHGIWFHSDDERTHIAQLIQTIVDECKSRDMAAPVPQQQQQQQTHQMEKAASLASAMVDALSVRESAAPAQPDASGTTTSLTTAVAMSSTAGSAAHERHSAVSAVSATAKRGGGDVSAVSAAKAVSSTQGSDAVPAITKQQLQETLMELLRDDRFIDMLHAQYLARVKARARK
eukprot:TRINITY_DN1691_c0_g1_i2.p1 TRINITY_DN1691_c0_g1~~TRINITY_DN1691_c0_g1_i2.p1  ORF type:complete len:292 (+),score=64.70 TRINITY_DN1691_c0_g1_i2:113-988(+)